MHHVQLQPREPAAAGACQHPYQSSTVAHAGFVLQHQAAMRLAAAEPARVPATHVCLPAPDQREGPNWRFSLCYPLLSEVMLGRARLLGCACRRLITSQLPAGADITARMAEHGSAGQWSLTDESAAIAAASHMARLHEKDAPHSRPRGCPGVTPPCAACRWSRASAAACSSRSCCAPSHTAAAACDRAHAEHDAPPPALSSCSQPPSQRRPHMQATAQAPLGSVITSVSTTQHH